MIKGFVIGLICFIVFLIVHVIIFHTREIKYRFLVILKIFLSILPLYILLYILIPTKALSIMPHDLHLLSRPVIILGQIFNFCMGLLIYLLLFFGYCQFYFIIDRSISIKIMIELEKMKGKSATFEQIKKIYNPDYIFSRRLKHMIDSKYLIEEEGSYKNTQMGKTLARLSKFLKEYLQLGEGG